MIPIFKKLLTPVTFVLIIAAFFRLYRIDGYMEFLGDQGRDVVVVHRFLTQGDLMFIGPQTSIGNMYLGPWFYYLIAPFLLLFNFNPVGPAVFIALLGVATSWLIFHLTNRIFNYRSALIAALLYAISPVAIKYNNFSWNPNIMPFFSLLFILSIYQAFFVKKSTYLILASISFIFCLNSHYLALLLLPIPAIYFIFNFKKLPPKFYQFLAVSVIIFLISLLPQILFDIKHGGQNVNAIIKFFTVREQTVNLKVYKSLPQFIPLIQQVFTRLAFGKNQFFGNILSLILVVLIIYQSLKNSHARFFSLWLFIGILGLGLYKQHIYDHYFGFIYPAIFISLSLLLTIRKPILKLLAVLLIIFSVVLSLIENPLKYSPNNQLSTTQEITKLIQEKSDNQPFNFALLAKQNYDPGYMYFFDLQNSPVHKINEFNQGKTNQLFVVCEPWQMECRPEGNAFWDIAAFGQAHVVNQWQINDIQIFKMIPSI